MNTKQQREQQKQKIIITYQHSEQTQQIASAFSD